MAPAGEYEHVSKEEEDVAPLDVVAPEVADHVHGEEANDEEEEEEPGEEEAPTPGPQSVAGKKVADRRDRGEEAKEAAVDNHPIPFLHLVGQGHCDEGNPGDEVADVEEEEKSEEGLGGPEDAGRLLVSPDRPEGAGEVPHRLHRDRGPLHFLSPGYPCLQDGAGEGSLERTGRRPVTHSRLLYGRTGGQM